MVTESPAEEQLSNPLDLVSARLVSSSAPDSLKLNSIRVPLQCSLSLSTCCDVFHEQKVDLGFRLRNVLLLVVLSFSILQYFISNNSQSLLHSIHCAESAACSLLI